MKYKLRKVAASDVFDNEVVVVNLNSGNYYSIQGAGLVLWPLLQKGVDIDQILQDCKKKYPENKELLGEITAFISQLLDEKLIEIVESTIEIDDEIWPTSIEPPVIEIYKDLQDLLLLDPIHGVEPDQGWPKEKDVSLEATQKQQK